MHIMQAHVHDMNAHVMQAHKHTHMKACICKHTYIHAIIIGDALCNGTINACMQTQTDTHVRMHKICYAACYV